MKIVKVKLPNGVEVEGEFTLDELAKIPCTVFAPAIPIRTEPAVASSDWWLCTCYTTSGGMRPLCAGCTKRGIVRDLVTMPGITFTPGAVYPIPSTFDPIPNTIIGTDGRASNVTSFSIKLSTDPT